MLGLMPLTSYPESERVNCKNSKAFCSSLLACGIITIYQQELLNWETICVLLCVVYLFCCVLMPNNIILNITNLWNKVWNFCKYLTNDADCSNGWSRFKLSRPIQNLDRRESEAHLIFLSATESKRNILDQPWGWAVELFNVMFLVPNSPNLLNTPTYSKWCQREENQQLCNKIQRKIWKVGRVGIMWKAKGLSVGSTRVKKRVQNACGE